MESYDVVVIGSCMIDLVCYTPKLPKSGETVHGTQFLLGHGGKGANQCVAAAKLGACSCLIARLGDDSFGKDYLKSLSDYGINTQNVSISPNSSSGMAQITVSETGENHIVIVQGANKDLCISDVKNAMNSIINSKVAIFQFETPLETTVETLKIFKQNNGPFTIVNGAPAVESINPSIYELSNIFCVNETEAESITGEKVSNIENAFAAVEKLIALGCQTVIITLGGKGAVFGSASEKPCHVSAKSVNPVDTTGAGDAFIGALAYFTAKFEKLSLEERIRRSCVVASQSVLKKGTQTSFPTKDLLPEQLFSM